MDQSFSKFECNKYSASLCTVLLKNDMDKNHALHMILKYKLSNELPIEHFLIFVAI